MNSTRVYRIQDPFQRQLGEATLLPPTATIWDAVKDTTGKEDFEAPTLCLADGAPVLRKDWSRPLAGTRIVTFVPVVGEPFTILLVVSLVLAATAVTLAFVLQPPRPGQLGANEPDSVFTLAGQRNQNRLGYPIEVPYGRNNLFPSYAAKPYTTFTGNDQWQYQLLCLGQGAYDVEQVYIEDTPIENFEDVTVETYQPGESVTLFPSNVVTSVEVGGIELFGTNEDEYTAPGDGFVANPAGSSATRLEVDIVLPQGLYYSADNGTLSPLTISVTAQYAAVDNLGALTGGWSTLATLTKSLATNTPQRFTIGATVAPGRYAVRAYRTNTKNTEARSGNTVRWDGLRAYLPDSKDYGAVTLLAIRARANNNLNDSASNRIRVVATRKLSKWNGTTWTALTTTRSVVWAVCDVFRSAYGGRFDDSLLDLEQLLDLDTDLEAEGIHFDGVIDQSTTLWEAAAIIARVGRCLPVVAGNLVRLVRDVPRVAVTAIFTPDNIVRGSLSWQLRTRKQEDPDGLEVKYIDATTWQEETVTCLLPGDLGTRPERTELRGCTDRTRVYREGLYMRAVKRHQRERLSFRTGREGHIPSYGDLITVSHDVARWGFSGLVVGYRTGGRVDLSDEVTFAAGVSYLMILRKRDGTSSPAYTVTAGVTSRVVVVTGLDTGDFPIVEGEEPPFYVIGPATRVGKDVIVVGISPGPDETVDLTCVNYAPEVYSYDTAEPTDVPGATGTTALPVIRGLVINPSRTVPAHAIVAWEATFATQYIVELSLDGSSWSLVATTREPSALVAMSPGYVYVRVSGVGRTQGPWSYVEGYVPTYLPTPVNALNVRLDGPFVGTTADIVWDTDPSAVSYHVNVLADGASVPLYTGSWTNVLSPAYVLDFTTMDGASLVRRDYRVEVWPVYASGRGPSSFLDVRNERPARLTTGFSSTITAEDSSTVTWRLSWDASTETDLVDYVVHGSDSRYFQTAPATLLGTTTDLYLDIVITKVDGGYAPKYWTVAARDVWGADFIPSAVQITGGGLSNSSFTNGFTNGFN